MENKIEVLKFSATWCGPCRVLAQTLKDVSGITNVDIEKEMDMAIKYNVRRVPTLVFLKDGVEVHRESGAIPKQKYDQILDELNLNK